MNSIEEYRHDAEAIRKTAEQLQKDLAMAGLEIEFSGQTAFAYEELKSQLIPIVENLYTHHADKFISLLYRMDVSEKKIREVTSMPGEEPVSARIAHLILEREFLKVLTRMYFSKR